MSTTSVAAADDKSLPFPRHEEVFRRALSSDPFDHFSEFIIISPFQRYGSLNSSSATLRRRCYSYEEAS